MVPMIEISAVVDSASCPMADYTGTGTNYRNMTKFAFVLFNSSPEINVLILILKQQQKKSY